jgi:putative transposase
MGRELRKFVIGTPYHIAHRVSHRRALFDSDEDRLYYLSLLHRFSRKTATRIAGFCLLSNHVHVIAVPTALRGLSECFGLAHRRYSLFLNARRGLHGGNWEGRFYSAAMTPLHAQNALRYIERNPVEAGLVGNPWEWRWSSAAQHCGFAARWPLLNADIRGEGMDPFTWRRRVGEALVEEELVTVQWASQSVVSDTGYCGIAG